MSEKDCILTTKDHTILEVMLERCLGRDDPMAILLTTKLGAARVVFGEDIPANVATLNSRVTFSVDGREPDTRVISHERMQSPVGLFLPLTSMRGLALIGLSEGQPLRFAGQDGVQETVVLESVLYQPEAARREKHALARTTPPPENRPVLTLIRGGVQSPCRPPSAGSGGLDDPGPPAA
ncbi:nucleoside-diphosphate kinase [Nitratireductor mangrovi]|uniref:Nucleoside-diphosphate kinase n=1 Tax=Nitratireductor mangrovi TaxID=2599600 RepID=A0A5B8L5H1_9HYPH|nr:nucleoside-diphosphate kinase [Nitratireductor mangrovi]QDZ03022.1 nucleoside-diphosphate kinase [Nitratireductor mangrovi]